MKEALDIKIDMHCHVKYGSIYSKVSLDEYITKLKEHGFEGMLITDHDTYKGYRHWKYHMKGKVHEDFLFQKEFREIYPLVLFGSYGLLGDLRRISRRAPVSSRRHCYG